MWKFMLPFQPLPKKSLSLEHKVFTLLIESSRVPDTYDFGLLPISQIFGDN